MKKVYLPFSDKNKELIDKFAGNDKNLCYIEAFQMYYIRYSRAFLIAISSDHTQNQNPHSILVSHDSWVCFVHFGFCFCSQHVSISKALCGRSHIACNSFILYFSKSNFSLHEVDNINLKPTLCKHKKRAILLWFQKLFQIETKLFWPFIYLQKM